MSGNANGIRSAVYDAVPDLGLHHAVASVRIGASTTSRFLRWSFAKPALAAALFWLLWRLAADVGPLMGPFPIVVASWWLLGFANLFTFVAILAVATGLISPTPTHRIVGGRLRPTRREPWKSTGPGYARIRATKEHLTREERRARRDVARATRFLGRWGAKRRRTWERQWAAEDQYSAGRSKPGSLDAFLMRRAPKPKAKAVKGSKAKKGKQHRKQLDAEWKDEVARIEAARADVMVPRLDPTAGPPFAPVPAGAKRFEDPMVAEWRRHAEAVEARTVHSERSRNGFAGHTPPPAPISVRDDQ